MNTSALYPALTSTFLISLLPNLLLIALPNVENIEDSIFLSAGQALAAGGLLGDVFLHTLAHSHSHSDHSESHGNDHHHHHDEEEHINPGLWILVGFTLFLFFDIAIKSLEEPSRILHSKVDQNPSQAKVSTVSFNSSTFLNLAADALHNFTDGLAIGASYASLNATATGGFLATVSIMLHEIPHEIGDYCVLIQHGFTKYQAIQTQFLTAMAAMVGTVVGVYSAQWEGINYITAGGFLYLACVVILPDVLLKASRKKQRFYILLAFVAGMGLLYIVAHLEAQDDHHHHHSHQTEAIEHHHHHENSEL